MTAVLTGADADGRGALVTEAQVRTALGSVVDPELDEPITDLGFVRSVAVTGTRIEVHLRLPTSFCSPNFAYLMASDAKDALAGLAPDVVVELDDHHDSELINRGLATDAGYRNTFGHEAEHSLDDLRATFVAKAHTAAMERALTAVLRSTPSLTDAELYRVTIAELPDGPSTRALLARRRAAGLGTGPGERVLVDEAGRPVAAEDSAARVRRARAVRISVDGNAHFCRGLLTTRYPGAEADQVPRADDDGSARTLLPLFTPERTSS
jgi:metal-sulfur cluster biosynthetic enzyme